MARRVVLFAFAVLGTAALHLLMWSNRKEPARPIPLVTPLSVACEVGDLAQVKVLLAAGADPNELSGSLRYSPLDRAVLHGAPPDWPMFTAWPQERPFGSSTATYLAIVKELLDQGGGLDLERPDYGGCPFHLAATSGYPPLIRVLVAGGRSTRVRDRSGGTPLHWVGKRVDEWRLEAHNPLGFEDAQETIRLIVRAGCDIDAADDEGRTALHESAQFGRLNVVRALVACGANVNVRDKCGLTPLDYARTVAIEKVIRDAGGKGLGE